MAKKQKPEPTSVGITSVRRSIATTAAKGAKRKVHGFTAAEAATSFPKGGAAFARWAESAKGVEPGTRMTEAEWAPLITEFANRPIHGHRRTKAGGNHRINRNHRR